ncbi:hypothetical protein KFZ56_00155 [Virgibacillus sp. NKC19-3]|uniref:hypothetical protein n=1 Tax=Virgibacillus saliphilus TaxID=2831674 RepID=UPI001C9A3B09|nr:hypothetical protein [Virgibacillus sp. NKC19-3]MBY7141544.1 hypothetical protein [Virgibacillus sp. NKC19-3]
MLKRLSMVLLTLIVALIGVLLAANTKTGETISFEEPILFWIGIGVVIILFLPSLILSIFNNNGARIAFAMCQGFIALLFLGLIPSWFLGFNGGAGASIIGIVGTVVSACSIAVTFFDGKNNGNKGVVS